jgi:hypothetical protein
MFLLQLQCFGLGTNRRSVVSGFTSGGHSELIYLLMIRKQHYDKSPNCPFFTEGIEGQVTDAARGDQAIGDVDDAVSFSGSL